MLHSYDYFETSSNFVKELYFYPSMRIDGVSDKKDLVAVSYLEKEELNDFDYSMVLIISYIFFIFFSIVSFKIFQKSNFISKVNISFFEEKLFILGSNLSIAVYLISDNVHYREIFLILLLPLVIKLKDNFKIKIFKYLFYFIFFRYIFFIFANYFIMFEKYFAFIYIKAFSDIVLVSLFTAICVIMNIEFLKQFTKK